MIPSHVSLPVWRIAAQLDREAARIASEAAVRREDARFAMRLTYFHHLGVLRLPPFAPGLAVS